MRRRRMRMVSGRRMEQEAPESMTKVVRGRSACSGMESSRTVKGTGGTGGNEVEDGASAVVAEGDEANARE